MIHKTMDHQERQFQAAQERISTYRAQIRKELREDTIKRENKTTLTGM